jgi:hypothetical protein
MARQVYCTYFDENYLSRGLALYHSLRRHVPDARLWVLCLSDVCHRALQKLDLPGLVVYSLADFEAADPDVAATRATRKAIEYYFTWTPAWLRFVRDRESDAEWVTYLDGDLYFFNSPDPIYDELRDASVAITPHRFVPKLARMVKFGIYNVGWVSARNDRDGREVIEWWRRKCIDWCYDYVDDGRFADQGYLDAFPKMSPRVKAIEHPGVNLAPWNVDNHRISAADGEVRIDGKWPLIFFHFQGLRRDLGPFFFTSHRRHRAPFPATVRRHIYKPYLDEVLAIETALVPVLEVAPAKPHRRATAVDLKQSVVDAGRRFGYRLFQVLDIVTGRALVVFRGSVH